MLFRVVVRESVTQFMNVQTLYFSKVENMTVCCLLYSLQVVTVNVNIVYGTIKYLGPIYVIYDLFCCMCFCFFGGDFSIVNK